jgi:cytochrome bd-type quinol oxidase subunit 2
MRTTIRSSLAVVVAAGAAALAAWAVIRLVGIDLTLKDSVGSQVGAVDVLAASLAAGLAAWGVFALLAHWRRARWWPFVGSTALAVSITGVVLILGFTRLMPRPYRGAGQASDHPQYHA